MAVVIVETRAFTARIGDLLSDEQYRTLQMLLIRRPSAGSVIPGTGGLRKLRWAAAGRGKRGGTRVIYFWHPASKPSSDALRVRQERACGSHGRTAEGPAADRRIGVPMKPELFEELRESVRQGGAILRGRRRPSRVFHVEEPDVRAVRKSYRLSQSKFAALMGISPATLRNWEQGRRRPEGSARILLRIVARHPEAVLDVVGKASPRHRP